MRADPTPGPETTTEPPQGPTASPPDEPATTTAPEPPPRRRSCLGCLGLALLLGALAALWGTTLAGRMDSTPVAPLVIAVLLLPWLHGAATALLLLLLATGRRRRWVWLPVLAHLGLEIGVRGDACAPSCRLPAGCGDADGPALRLVTWNVGRLGAFADDDEERCEPEDARDGVVQTILGQEPDVLVLLEISGRKLESLARDLVMDCQQIDYYGRGGKGTGGLAVCVRDQGPWKITRSRDLPLPPGWRYVFTELSDGETTFNVLALHVLPYGVTMREVERALRSVAQGQPGQLAAVLTQMEEAVATQVEQVASVQELVEGFHDPTIIAGDFNSTPDSAVHVALRSQLTDTWRRAGFGPGITRTVGGWLPLRIDYVYTTDTILARDAEVLGCRCDEGHSCSDHRALGVDLEIK